MQKFPSTDAKDKWGAITDAALQEPVTITKHGRPTLVITSAREYEELQQIKYAALKAEVAKGFAQLDRGEYGTMGVEEIKAEARIRMAKDRS